MALTLVTSDLIHGLDYSKLTGTITTWNQDTTGNAATATLAAGATILATARNIGGVSFNGSAAIDLPGVNTAGNQNTSGVAATATLLATARNINSVAFDGSADITIVDATKLPLAGGTLTGALSGTSAVFAANEALTINASNSTAANNTITGFSANLYAISVRQKGASAGIGGTNFMAQIISATGAEGLEIYTPNNKELILGTNATTRMTIGTTGAVGINSYTSTIPLEIKRFSGSGGTLRLIGNDNVVGMPSISFLNDNGGGGASIGMTSLNQLNLNGSIYVNPTGNVGIGTTSPSGRLDIGSSNGTSLQFLYDSSQAYRNNISNYWNSSTDTRMDFNIGRTANVAPVTVMSVGYNNNVGIGTTSPDKTLTVGSTAQAVTGIDIYTSGGKIWEAEQYFSNEGYQGMYYAGTKTIQFRANGDSYLNGGKVGIGTSSPAYKFETLGTSVITAAFGRSDYGVSNVMLIAMNGYRDVYKQAIGVVRTGDYDKGDMIFCLNGSANSTVVSASDEKMRISSGGQISNSNFSAANNPWIFENIGTNPYGPWFKFTTDANNSGNYYWVASALVSGSETVRAKMLSNGGLASYSGNNVNLASDIRLKKDIVNLPSEWDRLKQIKVVNYRYKDSDEERVLYGAIAQQVQEIYPNLVEVTVEATKTKPEYFGLREQPFQWLTTKVLQEAMTKIESQQTIIEDLKARIETLEG